MSVVDVEKFVGENLFLELRQTIKNLTEYEFKKIEIDNCWASGIGRLKHVVIKSGDTTISIQLIEQNKS